MKTATIASFTISALLSVSCGTNMTAMATSTPSPAASLTAVPTPTATPTITPSPPPSPTPRPSPPIGAFTIRSEFDISKISPAGHGPDVTIAAGPTVLVLATNSSAWIVDKAGVILDFKSMEDFFSSLRHPAVGRGTDPVVIYDPQSQRFFLVKSDWLRRNDCSQEECFGLITLAVSKSANPTSLSATHWHFFTFDRFTHRSITGTRRLTYFGDSDTLSVTDDVLAICWQFDSEGEWPGPNSVVRFIEKSPLVDGANTDNWTDVVDFTNGRVAQNIGESDTFFLANNIPYNSDIWAVRDPWPLPIVTSTRPTQFLPFSESPDIPQQGGPPIDALEGRTQPIYHAGALWMADMIWKDFGKGIVSAIQWMQLDVTGWPRTRVIQGGVLGEDDAWYFAPTIMVDESGKLALLYLRSTETDYISSHFTGRLRTDPLNTLRPSTTILSSEVPYARFEGTRNRFVDYLGMALDPEDGSVWMITIYPLGGEKSGSWVANMGWTTSLGP